MALLKYPDDISLFKVNKGNSRSVYKICSKLTTNAQGRCHKVDNFATSVNGLKLLVTVAKLFVL